MKPFTPEYWRWWEEIVRQPLGPRPTALTQLRHLLGGGSSRSSSSSSISLAARAFAGHTVPRFVLVSGLETTGKTTLLRLHASENPEERAGTRDLASSYFTIGCHTMEVRFGPFLPTGRPWRPEGLWNTLGGLFSPSVWRGEHLQHCFREYTLWAGYRKRASLDRHMFHTSDAVIWVYYASPSDDCHQLQTEEELTGYVLHPEGLPDDKPILILVNHKEAEAEAVKDTSTSAKLRKDFAKMMGTRTWNVVDVDILSGEGVLEGFQWLSDAMENHRPQEMTEVRKNIEIDTSDDETSPAV